MPGSPRMDDPRFLKEQHDRETQERQKNRKDH
jgi:hypothetical protein